MVEISPWIGIPLGAILLWLFFIALPLWVISLYDSSPPPPGKYVDLSKGVSIHSRQAQENILKAAAIAEGRRYNVEGQYGRDVIIAVDHLPEESIGFEVSEYQKWLVEHGPENKVFLREERHK